MTQENQVHELSDFSRERIKAMIKNDPAFGAIRGMLYNNLQEWKRLMFKINHDGTELAIMNVQGEVWDAMRLSESDKKFLAEELLSIDDFDFSDEFLIKIAKKTLDKLNKVKQPTLPQKNLQKDLKEAMAESLTGNPF